MLTSGGTEALIALEDDAPDVLFATFPGTNTYLWPHLRMDFAQAAAEVELNSIAVPRTYSRAEAYRRLLGAYLPNRSSTRAIRTPSDYCYVVGGVTTHVTEEGEENWLVDAFARARTPQSVVIQDRAFPHGRRTRVKFPHTFSFDAALARVDVATRLSPLSSEAVAAVSRVISGATERFGFFLDPERVARIERAAIYRLARIRHLETQYARLLDRVQPRVVVMEDASYGGRASVISMMKDRGIRVLEPQHGWIGPSHGAYNFGSVMSTPELKKTLPDVLLTFGDFWTSSVRHPAEVVSVGKPYLEEKARDLPVLAERPQDFLVVSSVAEPQRMAEFTLALRDALGSGWRVLFRAHPSERATVEERYPELVAARGVDFDYDPDVYSVLRRVRGVVGVASTVLYEALVMGCHVFVKDSPFSRYYIDSLFGETVDGVGGAQRMAEEVTRDVVPGIAPTMLESIWKPGAVDNFLRVLEP